MALPTGVPNPLNLCGARKLASCPNHFVKTTVKDITYIKKIDEWIYTNLNNRYCVTVAKKAINGEPVRDALVIGFEDPNEMTLFYLACPHINN